MRLYKVEPPDTGPRATTIHTGTMGIDELAELVTDPAAVLRRAGFELAPDKRVTVHVERSATSGGHDARGDK